jgi:transcriptional regulator with XRE-family HTH domain
MVAKRHKYRELGEVLEALRRKQGLTQIELAEKFHRPQNFISKIESGERRVDLFELIDILEIVEPLAAERLTKALGRIVNKGKG